MEQTVQAIPLENLAIAFIPVLLVLVIIWQWKLNLVESIYSLFRMLIQLLLIGYFLVYIFNSDSSVTVLILLSVMLVASSWIALRTIDIPNKELFLVVFISISVSGIFVLVIVSQGVVTATPWYKASILIPLGGMIFANSMTTISLAGERLVNEIKNGADFFKARQAAMSTSLIPIINSMFAVGLVSLPGMMTGQILAGVSPLSAVRYQIMVMCMIFGSSGLAAAIFLLLIKNKLNLKQTTS